MITVVETIVSEQGQEIAHLKGEMMTVVLVLVKKKNSVNHSLVHVILVFCISRI